MREKLLDSGELSFKYTVAGSEFLCFGEFAFTFNPLLLTLLPVRLNSVQDPDGPSAVSV